MTDNDPEMPAADDPIAAAPAEDATIPEGRGMRRRVFLGLGLAVLGPGVGVAAGITRPFGLPNGFDRTVELPTPPPALVSALERERHLVAALQAAQSTTSAPQLAPLLQNHRAHAQTILTALGQYRALPSGSENNPATVSPAPSLAELSQSEDAAKQAAAGESASLSGELAVLLGTISACEASHLELLTPTAGQSAADIAASTPVPALTAAAVNSKLMTAVQSLLAAEHAAQFGYRRLGPALQGNTEIALARRCESDHGNMSDALTAALGAAGQTAVSALADYSLTRPLAGPAAAEQTAVDLEDGCAAAARFLLLQASTQGTISATAAAAGTGSGLLRDFALAQLAGSAVRATRWRRLINPEQATVAYPGL